MFVFRTWVLIAVVMGIFTGGILIGSRGGATESVSADDRLAAPLPPEKVTVEKVKIFRDCSTPDCIERLERDINLWLSVTRGEIADRRLAMSDYRVVVTIFYREQLK